MGEWLAYTFALTGRREWGHGTQGVALGSGLVGLSARAGPQTRLFPHNLHQLNISILNTLRGQVGESVCSFSRQLVGEKTEILNVGLFFVVSLSLHPARPEKKYHYFRTLDFLYEISDALCSSDADGKSRHVATAPPRESPFTTGFLLPGMPMCSPPIFRRLNIPVRRSPWPTVPNGWRDGGVER